MPCPGGAQCCHHSRRMPTVLLASTVASWLDRIFAILPAAVETIPQADPKSVREPIEILNLAPRAVCRLNSRLQEGVVPSGRDGLP